jgi:hypothetical protein
MAGRPLLDSGLSLDVGDLSRYARARAQATAAGFDESAAHELLNEHPELRAGPTKAVADAIVGLRIAGQLHPRIARVALAEWREPTSSVAFRLGLAAALIGTAADAIDGCAVQLASRGDDPVDEIEFGAVGWLITDRKLIESGLEAAYDLALAKHPAASDAALATVIAARDLAFRAATVRLQHHPDPSSTETDPEQRLIDVERLGRLVGTPAESIDELAVALLE